MAITAASSETGGASSAKTSVVTLALCCFVAMFEGFDLQAAGVAAPRLGPAFHMSPGALGWFFSASTFGLMLGAAIGGRLSDRFGRKAVLIGSITVFGLLSLANGLAPNVELLMTARFLTGVGLGGALPNLVALASENADPGRRNTWVGALYGAMPTGGALVSLVSLAGAANDWRIVFFVGGIAPLVVVPLLVVALPESRQLKQARIAQAGQARASFAEALFGKGRASTTLFLWLSFFLALVTMYVLLNWLPTLLVSRGLSRHDASLVQVSFNVFSAMASVATGMTMDRAPLKVVVAGAFGVAAVGLLILWLAPVELAVSLVVGGMVGATISTTQALLYAVAPSLYPTAVRGTGVGSAVSVGRLGSAVGPLLAGALLGSGGSAQQVVMVLIPTILISGAAALAVAAGRSKLDAG